MYQKVTLVGNLGSDPEKGDRGPCRLSVATSRSYLKDGKKVTETEWHRVTVWGPQGDACAKFLAKGRPVLVEGRIKSGEYLTGEGEKKRSYEIIAESVQFLPGGKARDEESPEPEDEDPPSDDIPF